MFVRVMILALLLTAGLAETGTTTVPSRMSVQGRLTDLVGAPLPAGLKEFRFRIFDANTLGTQLWPINGYELHNLTSDAAGLWSTSLGYVSPLSAAVFSDTVRWLQVEVDGTTLPRIRLVTGPYAFRVATVDGASGGLISSKVTIGTGHAITGNDAFVAGTDNSATGNLSVISGGSDNTAEGLLGTVGGGSHNAANGASATSSGGEHNLSLAQYATVGGGRQNYNAGPQSTVAGGEYNTVFDTASSIGGGSRNYVRGRSSSIGGGRYNSVLAADYATISGGGGAAEADSNWVTADYGTISGGHANAVTGEAGVIGGGEQNVAGGDRAAVGGGVNNHASGLVSVIAGGSDNNATLLNATVGGGALNDAFGIASTIGGGESNAAQGAHATIPGGHDNQADGDYSFAAGRRAKALSNGCFVWSDNTAGDFSSTAVNQFLVRASGGVGIGEPAPLGALHVNQGPNSIALYVGTGTRDIVWADNQALQFGQWDGAAFSERVRVASGGHVGIGTTTTTNILTLPDVASAEGRGLANAWSVYSSRRWKDSINTITNALEKVSRLRGVTYVHKSDGMRDIGLIAEEVGAVVPEVVQYEDNGVDAQSVDYSRLIALLIEGMKEQQKEIEALNQKINQMTP